MAALLLLFMATSPQTFLSWRIYMAFMATIPFTALLAMGLTFAVVSGEMDLSFPSIMAVTGLVFCWVFTATKMPLLALLAALATGGMAGALNGVIVVGIGVPSIIATIGTQFFWRGLATVLAGGLALNIAEVRETPLHAALVGRIWDAVPAQFLWCLGLTALFWLLLNRHVFGDALLFIGDDIRAARALGVRTGLMCVLLFTLIGVVSAFVSVLVCLEMANWWPTMGEGYLLLVFASVFIGGTSVFGGQGTLYGTLVGSIIIGIIEAGIISAGLSGFWTRLVYGLIVIVSVSIYALAFQARRE